MLSYGIRTYVTEVVASNVEFLGSASDNSRAPSQNEENPFDESPVIDNNESLSVDNDPFAAFGEKVEISDSELPF